MGGDYDLGSALQARDRQESTNTAVQSDLGRDNSLTTTDFLLPGFEGVPLFAETRFLPVSSVTTTWIAYDIAT